MSRQLAASTEELSSIKESMRISISKMETEVEVANAESKAAYQELEQSNTAVNVAYTQLKENFNTAKLKLQNLWSHLQQALEMADLQHLSRFLSDEVRWYQGQEAMWRATDMKNHNELLKLNRELMAIVHVYGELDQEKAKTLALRVQNARLQYELEKCAPDHILTIFTDPIDL
ncbi:hypothetical protein BDZ94DRAFT_1239144 [Collybia nuda]|uniref:Uncharacterized protein n=1 Tax=Collybia nuda TaxID=64659 RepID=A0A9P5Y1C6_9AGAR|nr:hypothetical protein BDZ94DRAFT_1239144 [Collybia nuda]